MAQDRLLIYRHNEYIVMGFDGIERDFPHRLHILYRNNPCDIIRCIRGPGTFTNMRVAVLSIQTLNYYVHGSIQYRVIDKLTMYHNAYTQGLLPRYGIVTIGQRKKLAIRDAHTQTIIYKAPYHDVMTIIQDLCDKDNEQYYVDTCFGHDFPDLTNHPDRISLSYTNDDIILGRHAMTVSIQSRFHTTLLLQPFYLNQ